MNQMSFKRPCSGKELAFRFRFPSCHNHRPFGPSDTLTAPGGRPSLGTVSRPHPPPRRLLIGRCAKALLRGMSPRAAIGPSRRRSTLPCFPGQPSEIAVVGRLVPIGTCDWCSACQAHRLSKRGLAGAASVNANGLPRLSSWPPAGNTFSRISRRRASGCSVCSKDRKHRRRQFIYQPRKPLPRPR